MCTIRFMRHERGRNRSGHSGVQPVDGDLVSQSIDGYGSARAPPAAVRKEA
jgi:hypothetical protein